MSESNFDRNEGVNSPVNFYQLLGVSTTATPTEIRSAYLSLKANVKSGNEAYYSLVGEGEARRYQELIETAYHTLSDEKNKKIYDSRFNYGSTNRSLSLENESKILPTNESAMTYKFNASFFKPTPDILAAYNDILLEADYGCGTTLKKLREAAGLSVEQLWSISKISVDYIHYFENNSFDKLPALVYVKGLLKSYLTSIGIDTWQEIHAKYINRYLDARTG